MNRLYASLLTCLISLSTAGILSADDLIFRDLDYCTPEVRKRSVWASFGHLNARANEYVYGGPGGADGNQLSRLVWDANNALTFNLGFEGEINNRWSLFGETAISAAFDDSNMVDYDWVDPLNTDWTHRSEHPNTDLNHYVQVDLGIDYKLMESERVTFLVRGGFRYTDISFDSTGGSYIYSDTGFRDSVGTFPDIVGLSYRQKIRGLYIGPRLNFEITPRLSFKAGALAGITFNSSGRDHHWLRSILFVDDLESTAFYGATVGLDYALTPSTILYVEGSFDRYNQTEGHTYITDPTGTYVTGANAAGADLETTQIKAGVRINGWNKELFPDMKRF